MKKYGLLLFCLLILSGTLPAQSSNAEKKRQAKDFFVLERYENALAILTGNRQLIRTDEEARFLAAVCHYQLNQLNEAFDLLQSLTQENKAPYPECWLYLGRIFHNRHQFAEATRFYKIYLQSVSANHPYRQMVIEDIRRCANGIGRQFQPAAAVVENLGNRVNTKGDEFGPVLSPNFSDRLYFSSIREGNAGGKRDRYGRADDATGWFFSDMFTSRLSMGTWDTPEPMHYLLNSPRHEVLLDFNRDGSALYYFKGWSLNSGEIVIDSFRQVDNRVLSSTPWLTPVNAPGGDQAPFFYNDTLLLFASRRPGGFGGLDLYQSRRLNGRWSSPENLGPDINTAFDETTPFLARDGRTLFFSSNDSHKSIGGFDVFKSFFVVETRRWTLPENLGLPVNSAADDAFFRIAVDGFTAFLASSRKDGYGQRDLYVAYFQDFLEEMEAPSAMAPPHSPMVNPLVEESPFSLPDGITPLENVPPGGDEWSALYFPNGSTLTRSHEDQLRQLADRLRQEPGGHLVISAYADGSQPAGEALFAAIRQAENLAGFLMKEGIPPGMIFLRGLQYTGANAGGITAELSAAPSSQQSEGFPVIGGSFSSIAKGQPVNEALHYKVQIASARGELNASALAGNIWPMVEKTPGFPYYRYTLGAFPSYREADQYRRRLQAQGRFDAFIVPYIFGLRADKEMAKQYQERFPDLGDYLGQ